MNLPTMKALIAPLAIATGAGLVVGLPALSLAQTAQPKPNPVLRQFGPRVAPARPQQRAPARRRPSTAKILSKHGAWAIQCDVPRSAAASKKPSKKVCGMVQFTQHPKRKNVGLTLILVKGKQNGKPVTMMRVMAPIGVYLPTGIALEIDGKAVGRVPFTRCLPQTCVAFAEASPPTLAKLKKGSKANFIIYEAPGLGISLRLSLKGFTAGLEALGKL